MPYETWVEHRRTGDRELLGWVRPEGEAFVAVDLLGRDLTGPVDWLAAEEALEGRGLHWLAELWQLTLEDGARVRVRLVEVSPRHVLVKEDDMNAVDTGRHPVTYELPFPAPSTLGPFTGDGHTLDPRG